MIVIVLIIKIYKHPSSCPQIRHLLILTDNQCSHLKTNWNCKLNQKKMFDKKRLIYQVKCMLFTHHHLSDCWLVHIPAFLPWVCVAINLILVQNSSNLCQWITFTWAHRFIHLTDLYPIHLSLCSDIGAKLTDRCSIYARQQKLDFERVDKHTNAKAPRSC